MVPVWSSRIGAPKVFCIFVSSATRVSRDSGGWMVM